MYQKMGEHFTNASFRIFHAAAARQRHISVRRRWRIAQLLQIFFATGALLLVICDEASATVDLFTIGGQPVVLSATEQSREEVWNWFAPTNPAEGPDYQNRYNFMGSWIRVGLGYQFDGVKAFAELMSPFFINLPDNAIITAGQDETAGTAGPRRQLLSAA